MLSLGLGVVMLGGCSQSHSNSKVADRPASGQVILVRYSDAKINETYAQVDADIKKVVRRGLVLEISYDVGYCEDPAGMDVSYVRSGSTQIISLSGMVGTTGSANCQAPPTPYSGVIDVPVLPKASTFKFARSLPPTSSSEPTGQSSSAHKYTGDSGLSTKSASEIFNKSGTDPAHQYSCQSIASIPKPSEIAKDFDYVCTPVRIDGASCNVHACAGYAVDFMNGQVSSIADLNQKY